jgi:hypothetical protein
VEKRTFFEGYHEVEHVNYSAKWHSDQRLIYSNLPKMYKIFRMSIINGLS